MTEAEIAAEAELAALRARHAAQCVEHDKLARHFVTRITGLRSGPSYEDALQEARIALLTAVRKFEPERKVKFAAFAGQGITYAMWRWLTLHGRCGFTYLPNFRHDAPVVDRRPESLDDTYGDGNPVHQPTAREIEDAESREIVELAESLLGSLRPRDRRILRMYFWDSMTYQEIGRTLRVSRARIGQLIDRALRNVAAEARRQGLTREIMA